MKNLCSTISYCSEKLIKQEYNLTNENITKEQLKSVLEAYWFDNQYLKEKTKEINSVSNLLSNTGTDQVFSDSIEYEKQQMRNILNKKRYIESLIQNLGQPYKTIIYMKYVAFLTFDQIAGRMNYSTKRIYQLHNEALNKLLLTINENGTNISVN